MPGTQEETDKPSKTVTMEEIPLDQVMVDGEGIAPQEKEEQAKGHKHSPSRIGSVYRKTGGEIRTVPSAHPVEIDAEDPVDAEASWGDVCRACCCHTATEWVGISVFLVALLGLLYFFLFGLDLLGTSFRVVGGCTAASLLGSDTNPLASVMIGIIATALLQSSSTTTSIIVSLVSGGLNVKQGIYMVMGANVGTSITSMLVSLSHMGDGAELERAFSASVVGFVFKFLTVIILFPLEVTTGYLYKLTLAMLPSSVGEGDTWEGPIKKIISPLTRLVIIANKDLIADISTGDVASCDASYPVTCSGSVSYLTCKAGLIGCNEQNDKCPLFFQNGATKNDDMVSGWVCLVAALTVLIVCLIGLVALLRSMLLGASTRIIYKATSINPFLAMIIGCGVTILVQSSSITTSVLIPLAGVGVLKLPQIYPLTLGADIGTTFTALMAAMVSSNVQSLQIALSHLFFNVTGIVIWYPIPFMRRFVMNCARRLARITRGWRSFPVLFIVLVYFLVPLLILGISTCFEQQTAGFTALGVFLLLLIFGAIAYFYFWWKCKSGKASCQACIKRRQRKSAAIRALADDMDYLKVDMEYCKNEIGRIKDFAGIARPAAGGMEEGLPVEEEVLPTEEDEAVSLYESCMSKPWRDVLVTAAGSIQDELQGSTRLTHRTLQGSTRRRRNLQSSTGTHASRPHLQSSTGTHASRPHLQSSTGTHESRH